MFIVMLTRPATQKITLLCSLKIHNIGPLKLREERINSNAKKNIPIVRLYTLLPIEHIIVWK